MGEQLYECMECGLHYAYEETAGKCEAWCIKTNSCNIEIAQQSVEYTHRNGNKVV